MVDGCSRFGAFMRVTLPLLGPGIVTASVFSFLQAWNEYTLALVVMTKPGSATFRCGWRAFSSEISATDWAGNHGWRDIDLGTGGDSVPVSAGSSGFRHDRGGGQGMEDEAGR